MIVPEEDIDRIMTVMEQAFPPEFGEAWTRRQLADALLVGNCRYGLITPGGGAVEGPQDEVAGFYLARGVLDEEELLLFAIAPQWRQRGLGHALMRRLIDEARARGARRLFLEMRRGNPAAVLYASHGFRPVAVRPGYYRGTDGTRHDAVSQELLLQ